MSLSDLRREYALAGLKESDLDPNPFKQFDKWFQQALAAGLPEPNAMTLATATLDGKPSARVVLLKGFDERGFVFFTNYESQKGRELSANPLGSPGLLLGRVGAAGAHQRPSEPSVRRRVGSLFSQSSPGQPVGRLGVTTERGRRRTQDFGRQAGRANAGISNEAGALTSLLGWVSRGSRNALSFGRAARIDSTIDYDTHSNVATNG